MVPDGVAAFDAHYRAGTVTPEIMKGVVAREIFGREYISYR